VNAGEWYIPNELEPLKYRIEMFRLESLIHFSVHFTPNIKSRRDRGIVSYVTFNTLNSLISDEPCDPILLMAVAIASAAPGPAAASPMSSFNMRASWERPSLPEMRNAVLIMFEDFKMDPQHKHRRDVHCSPACSRSGAALVDEDLPLLLFSPIFFMVAAT